MNPSEDAKAGSSAPFLADQPLTSPGQDRLGRKEFAVRLAQQLREYDDPLALVVGIYGPWGTGKSTLLNFLARELAVQSQGRSNPVVVRFNPWNYSAMDQLINMALTELGTAMGRTGG